MTSWSCHGYEGQGAVTGPKLAPDPLPKEAFVAFTRTTDKGLFATLRMKFDADSFGFLGLGR